MGLFSNNKKLCPICNNPTPRLLSTKVEGVPICKECAAKIFLPDGALDQMSLDEFRQYIEFYEDNKELRDAFSETYSYNFGFFDTTLLLDVPNRLFRFFNSGDGLVMGAANLKSFRILEDDKPLFESGVSTLICHKSNVPDKINEMAPLITQFGMELREYEMWEQMEEMRRERNGQDNDRRSYRTRPTFDAQLPFQHFNIEITLEHPYWSIFTKSINAPDFSTTDPSVVSYMQEYNQKVEDMHKLATNLMQIICPGAGERQEGGASAAGAAIPAAAAGGSAADEIQKYKALLDAGAITEEEYAAKKRQLLGI